MLGVLLNLVLGLSRVWLALARRGDAPRGLAVLDSAGSPRRAVLLTGALVACLVLTGSVRATWSFSAFTVLVYYALTNLSALRLAPEQRLCPRWVPAAGLVACLGLAFWVEPRVWASGLALAAAGLVWHAWRRGRQSRPRRPVH
jgi:APA family basic amino acid/polyamine antiporter